MNIEKSGQLIAEMRKSKNMTQRDLAEKLHVTDKAVSKWERGLASPDIQLLPHLSEIFGITIDELINGELEEFSIQEPKYQSKIQEETKTIKKTQKRPINIKKLSSICLSMSMFIGILVCLICDLSINKIFTWSIYPISSIIFSWLVLFPVTTFGKKGVLYSLINLSIFIFPFFLILERMLPNLNIFLIGSIMSAISLIFIWIIYIIFALLKKRIYLASTITTTLLIPLYFCIDIALHFLINEPIIDIWDILSLSIIIIIAIVLFIADYKKMKILKNK